MITEKTCSFSEWLMQELCHVLSSDSRRLAETFSLHTTGLSLALYQFLCFPVHVWGDVGPVASHWASCAAGGHTSPVQGHQLPLCAQCSLALFLYPNKQSKKSISAGTWPRMSVCTCAGYVSMIVALRPPRPSSVRASGFLRLQLVGLRGSARRGNRTVVLFGSRCSSFTAPHFLHVCTFLTFCKQALWLCMFGT